MKVLFFGTPSVAVPYLDWLLKHVDVVGVVCRPDEPVGRGYTVTAPPTKVLAEANKIPVLQPEGAWTDEIIQSLKSLQAEVGVVVAYGRLLPENILKIPRLGCLNIHFSLLPKYRGAAPMQWALLNGESQTGVTSFWLDAGMDKGPIFHQAALSIDPTDDSVSLREKLVDLGLQVLDRSVSGIQSGSVVRRDQKGVPTMAPLLTKEMGRIKWAEPAQKINNYVRGLRDWPGTVTTFGPQEKKIKIIKAMVLGDSISAEPGTVVEVKDNEGFVVATGSGKLLVLVVKPEGKGEMSAWSFWQGARLNVGDKLL